MLVPSTTTDCPEGLDVTVTLVAGTGILTVKMTVLDAPPEFPTAMFAVPVAAISDAGTVAVN